MASKVAQMRGSAHEEACNELCRAQIAQSQGARDVARACLDRATVAFDKMQMVWHLEQARCLLQSL
jgi:hypothetical protein